MDSNPLNQESYRFKAKCSKCREYKRLDRFWYHRTGVLTSQKSRRCLDKNCTEGFKPDDQTEVLMQRFFYYDYVLQMDGGKIRRSYRAFMEKQHYTDQLNDKPEIWQALIAQQTEFLAQLLKPELFKSVTRSVEEQEFLTWVYQEPEEPEDDE